MANYLVSSTEVYRIDSEKEVAEFIDAAKADRNFTLSKYASEHKEVKSKGEVVDDYFKVTLVKQFTDIKEPLFSTTITYNLTEVEPVESPVSNIIISGGSVNYED